MTDTRRQGNTGVQYTLNVSMCLSAFYLCGLSSCYRW